MRVAIVGIAIVVAACKPIIANMLITVDIIIRRPADSTRNDLINLDENFQHYFVADSLLQSFPFVGSKLDAELEFFCAFLFSFCEYQNKAYFYTLLSRIFNYHQLE